jgi:hypothetical protein
MEYVHGSVDRVHGGRLTGLRGFIKYRLFHPRWTHEIRT